MKPARPALLRLCLGLSIQAVMVGGSIASSCPVGIGCELCAAKLLFADSQRQHRRESGEE
ncbi:hypothetical protein AQ611_17005 [Burkholderia singularis]|nr:hypothetical protein AQ611_17005 [Burkholderia sp. Bp7605]